jgi:hypothetical protein
VTTLDSFLYDNLNTSYDILDRHNIYDEHYLIRTSWKVLSDTLSMTFIFFCHRSVTNSFYDIKIYVYGKNKISYKVIFLIMRSHEDACFGILIYSSLMHVHAPLHLPVISRNSRLNCGGSNERRDPLGS